MMKFRNMTHRTESEVDLRDGDIMSLGQAAKVKWDLCGIKGCRCGNDLAMCGPQTITVKTHFDGYQVFCKTESNGGK